MKNSKRSLAASGLSLAVSAALLLGTTFAWFTDSVTSANNKIQAGNLEVALQEWNAETKQYEDVGTAPIFDYDKWEPGYSDTAVLKVSNEGSLALKYQLNLVARGGDAGILGDVIDVYALVSEGTAITEVPANLDAAIKAGYENVGTLNELMADEDGAAHGVLYAEEDVPEGGFTAAYAGIILHMQETAGNEYQDETIGTTFDIQLKATQFTYEKDGFGNDQYDANASDAWDAEAATDEEMAAITDDEAKTVSISTGRQLAGLAAQVNKGNTYEGYTVTLLDDIDLGNRPWTPIGNAELAAGNWDDVSFNGSFDGNGKTISNLYVDLGEKTADVGFFGMLNLTPDAFIRNITFENAYVNGEKAEGVGVLAGAASGGVYNDNDNYMPCLIENVTVTDAKVIGRKYVGGVIGYSTTCLKNVTVSDVDVTAKYNAELVDSGENAGAVVGDLYALFSIDGAKVSDSVVSGSAKVSGVAGSSHHADMIKNCTVSNVQMIIDPNSTDERFGWISGRANVSNVGKYTYNTVTGCTATKDGTVIDVPEVYSVNY